MLFPHRARAFESTRFEVAEFAQEADASGHSLSSVSAAELLYLTRSLAEALGRTPPASRYSPDMSKHAYYGSDPLLKPVSVDFADQL
jgi:betaine-homocysteine S-methyltransferase